MIVPQQIYYMLSTIDIVYNLKMKRFKHYVNKPTLLEWNYNIVFFKQFKILTRISLLVFSTLTILKIQKKGLIN